jgi:hypothetical protein
LWRLVAVTFRESPFSLFKFLIKELFFKCMQKYRSFLTISTLKLNQFTIQSLKIAGKIRMEAFLAWIK